jgi:molecular chaperone DnaK
MGEPFIGIDLGTTNSAAATVVNDRPVIIPSRSGGNLTPSIVAFTPDGERFVGESARRKAYASPENAAYAMKRFIGRKWSSDLVQAALRRLPYSVIAGPNDDVRIRMAGNTYSVPELSAMILTELRLDAERYFGSPVKKAVISVPANFDDAQRQATKEAAEIAGLDLLRILNEPTAAALAYGLGADFVGKVVIFDLGGGTFDVSILDIRAGVFQVLATGGDTFLGGEDFDNEIVEWLVAQLAPPAQASVRESRDSLQRLKSASEQAKRELSTIADTRIHVALVARTPSGVGVDLTATLTRPTLESLTGDLVERCIALCDRVLDEAKLAKSKVDSVLLVGGMTRMPRLRQRVTDFFGKEPAPGFNPDEVVALGASIQAAALMKETKSALLLDITPHSLGVAVAGGYAHALIKKGTGIPCRLVAPFSTVRDGQTTARITILQGDSERAGANQMLGQVVLDKLPPARRGEVPIEVEFEIGFDGTLAVAARDLTSGQSEKLTIQAKGLLAPGETKRLAKQEEQYVAAARSAETEARASRHEEMIAEAEGMLATVRKATEDVPGADAAVTAAQQVIEDARRVGPNNSEALAASIRELDRVIQSFREVIKLTQTS